MARGWVACLLAAAVVCGGCWDRSEIEDTAFAVALGVDTADAEFLWTFRIAQVGQLPTGILATPSAGPDVAGLITVRGASLEQAVQLVQAGVARILSLEHLRYVVFGQGLAEEGLETVLNQLLRHNQVRRGVGAAVAVGRAVDVLAASQPAGEVNIAKFMEGILLVQKRMHLSPPLYFQNFYGRLLSGGVDPILPLVAVNPLAGQPPGSDLPPMAGRSLQAGEFPRAGGSPMEVAGAAIFRGDRLVGSVNVDETAAILALRGEMGKVYASVPDPREPGQVITLRLHQENKPQYQAEFAGDRPVVDIRLQFEGEILSASGRTNWAEPPNLLALESFAARHLERSVYAPLLPRLYAGWGADPVGLGNLFRRQFPTFDAWRDYRWQEHVRDVRVNVDIVLFIRRFGLLLDATTAGD